MRGAVVEWLERLDSGAESRRKFICSRLFRHPTTGKHPLSPSSKWVPFLNQGRIRQQKERDGLRIFPAVPKISGTLIPIVAVRL